MGELEDSLNQVLQNPEQMEKIANLAKSLMGGGAPEKSAEMPSLDPKMIQKISGLMNGDAVKDGKDRRLLDAMRPYLSEKRRSKMDKAMKLAKMARIASIAAEEFGGKEDV